MCREHPKSRYHDIFLFVLFSAKDICNKNYLLLRYPQFLGSFLVSSPQVLIELGFSKIFNRRNNMIFFRFVSMIFLRMCLSYPKICPHFQKKKKKIRNYFQNWIFIKSWIHLH